MKESKRGSMRELEEKRRKWFNYVINLKKIKKYSLRKELNLVLEQQQGNHKKATTFLSTMVTCLYCILLQ